MVAVQRLRLPKEPNFSRIKPIKPARTVPVDKEIDMRRRAPHPSWIMRNISRLLLWMLPPRNSMGPPMRSVAREAEEIFPSNDGSAL